MKDTLNPFCCLNKSCGCGQNEKLHDEIHNVPFELNDEELLTLTKKRPYQYIQIAISCDCYDQGCEDFCRCNDNRNLIRRALPNEMTPKIIAKLENFRKDWLQRYQDYRGQKGAYKINAN